LPFLWFILIVSGFFHPTAIGRSYLLAPAELASPGFAGEGVKKIPLANTSLPQSMATKKVL